MNEDGDGDICAILVFILEMILNNRHMKGAAQFRYRNSKQIK